MRKTFAIFVLFLVLLLAFGIFLYIQISAEYSRDVLSFQAEPEAYWFLLHRNSNLEYLYEGVPGQKEKSKLVRTFKVKTGAPNKSPTPLPQLLGRKYWVIVDKQKEEENPETSPYFLTLNIPVSDTEPFGPTPYLECGTQCSWNLPGYFGLHGVGGNSDKLLDEDPGSSGCIRHSDEDITYLYSLLDPKKDEIRYYIQD